MMLYSRRQKLLSQCHTNTANICRASQQLIEKVSLMECLQKLS